MGQKRAPRGSSNAGQWIKGPVSKALAAMGVPASALKSGAGGPVPEYDPSPLTFGKSAGGSTGARIAKHTDGGKWLVKTYGGNEDRVAAELLANAVYRYMGARVARAGRIRLNNGKQGLSYPLLDGKPREYVFQGRGDNRSAELGQHFMVDALVANWDVAGLADDNVLWDDDGKPFRVDQGGTFAFRAMGGPKPFGPVPVEVTTMLSPGGQAARSMRLSMEGMRAQALEIEARLTPEAVDELVSDAGFKNVAMREKVRKNLKARAEWMGRFGRGEVGLPPVPVQQPKSKPSGLLEAVSTFGINWNEFDHPRDQQGKFRDKLQSANSKMWLQIGSSKVRVRREPTGGGGASYRVKVGNTDYRFSNAGDATRFALDKASAESAAGTPGEYSKLKDFNTYLVDVRKQAGAAAGTVQDADGGTGVSFDGKVLGAEDAEGALGALRARVKLATESDDKYVKRGVGLLKAREKELAGKVGALGGNTKAGSGFLTDDKVKVATPASPPAPASGGKHFIQNGTGQGGVADVALAVGKASPGSVFTHSDNPGAKLEVLPEPGTYSVTTAGLELHYTSKIAAAQALVQGEHKGTGYAPPSGLKPGDTFTNFDQISKGDVYSYAGMELEIFHVGDDGTKYSKLKGEPDPPLGQAGQINPQAVVPQGAVLKSKGGAAATLAAPGKAVGQPVKKVEDLEVGDVYSYNGNDIEVYAIDGTDVLAKDAKMVGTPANKYSGIVLGKGTIMAGAKYVKVADGSPGSQVPPAAGKPPKKIKGAQRNLPNPVSGPGIKASLKQLDLVPGDQVQFKKGGWKYTYKGPATLGEGMLFVAPNGKQKNWQGYAKPELVTKADGSPLALKGDAAPAQAAGGGAPSKVFSVPDLMSSKKQGMEPGQYEVSGGVWAGVTVQKVSWMGDDILLWQAPGKNPFSTSGLAFGGEVMKGEREWPSPGSSKGEEAADYIQTKGLPPKSGVPSSTTQAVPAEPKPKGPSFSVEEIKTSLVAPTSEQTLGSLPEGTLIQTPAGEVAIMKPSVDAYTGYTSAYVVSTGKKIEVPSSKPPVKMTTSLLHKEAAEAHLAKANAGTTVTTATGTSSPAMPGPDVGPPAQFNGVASWQEAKKHIPSANSAAVGLTPDEKEAIQQYTNGAYGEINGLLRDSKAIGSLMTAKRAAAIKKALRKGVVKYDVWIGRQTDNDQWKSSAKAGSTIQDNGVMSSSTTEGTWSGNITLNVLIRAGSNALHVKSISSHPSEDEVLMPPGSMFHVLKREEKGGKTVLWVEMIT